MTSEFEEKYRSILNNIEELYYEVDLAGNLTLLNGSMTKILGYSMEELIGMNNRQYMSPETAKRVYHTFNQVYRTGISTKAFDWELIRKDGTIRILETSVSLMHDPEGQPIGFYGIGRDITERRQMEEKERSLRRAKDKALNHLSHELRTPLSIAQGITRILKKRLQAPHRHPEEEKLIWVLEKHLNRLIDIQQKADRIIQYHQSPDEGTDHPVVNQLPSRPMAQWKDLNAKITQSFLPDSVEPETVNLFPLVQTILHRTKQISKHRDIQFLMDGDEDLCLRIDPKVVEEIFEGLLRNAIENTPDEGMVHITLESNGERSFLKVQDFGIGITEENQEFIFDGLFATREIESYSSKKPYDFYAGGNGLDLFKMKVCGQHFGFDISVKSERCPHLPTDKELCPGKISQCPHCKDALHCYASGGSTFCLSFPKLKDKEHEKRNTSAG